MMTTVILPGYSKHNKEWMEKLQKRLNEEIKLTYWPHWNSVEAEANWMDKQAEMIVKENSETINVVAKSIGTVVAGKIWEINPKLINKIVLCGLPINDLGENHDQYFTWLEKIIPENVLIIQNLNDPHGQLTPVRKMLQRIKANIYIEATPGSDHEYNYPDLIKEFLAR